MLWYVNPPKITGIVGQGSNLSSARHEALGKNSTLAVKFHPWQRNYDATFMNSISINTMRFDKFAGYAMADCVDVLEILETDNLKCYLRQTLYGPAVLYKRSRFTKYKIIVDVCLSKKNMTISVSENWVRPFAMSSQYAHKKVFLQVSKYNMHTSRSCLAKCWNQVDMSLPVMPGLLPLMHINAPVPNIFLWIVHLRLLEIYFCCVLLILFARCLYFVSIDPVNIWFSKLWL